MVDDSLKIKEQADTGDPIQIRFVAISTGLQQHYRLIGDARVFVHKSHNIFDCRPKHIFIKLKFSVCSSRAEIQVTWVLPVIAGVWLGLLQ